MASFPMPDEQINVSRSIIQLVIGAIPALFSKSVAAPSERVKLLIQNQDELIKAGRLTVPYAGIVDCIRRTYAAEGFLSFWRGNMATLLRHFPSQMVNAASRPYFQSLFDYKRDRDGYVRWFTSNLLVGGLAGASSLAFVYSLDFARVRLANDILSAQSLGGARQYSGLIDVYRKTLATDGIAGLYSGFLPSVLGIFAYRALFFGLNDLLRSVGFVNSLRRSSWGAFFFGWFVTTLAGLLAYPFDTIRSRMIASCCSKMPYTNMLDAAVHIVESGGISALFAGASMHVLTALGSAAAFSLFHFVARLGRDSR